MWRLTSNMMKLTDDILSPEGSRPYDDDDDVEVSTTADSVDPDDLDR